MIKRTDDYAGQGNEFAEDNAEPRDEAVSDNAGIQGSKNHSADADEGEEADYERVEVIRRSGEEEGQGGPEISKSCRGEDRD